MPDSRPLTFPSTETPTGADIEIVMPDDGKRESLWVWLLIVAVLSSGALGIWLRQDTTHQRPYVSLAPAQSQQLMALSIAHEEIVFLTEKPWPTPADLAQLGVELFAPSPSHQWHQPENDCYQWMSQKQTGDFLLRMSDGRIFYHPGKADRLLHCTPDEHWILMDN